MTLEIAELARIRADLESETLPDTCTLLTVTRAADGAGGMTDTWGTAATNVKCRVDFVRGAESANGAALRPFTGWMLTVPQSTTITAQYRVVHSGNTYSIQAVSEGGSWLACKRAQLERV